MFGMSPSHLLLLFLIVLIVFGPKQLPRVGQALGRGIREFKDATKGLQSDLDDEEDRKRQKTTVVVTREPVNDPTREPRLTHAVEQPLSPGTAENAAREGSSESRA